MMGFRMILNTTVKIFGTSSRATLFVSKIFDPIVTRAQLKIMRGESDAN